MPGAQPELKKVSRRKEHGSGQLLTVAQYVDKRVYVQLNGSRKVEGVVRGYDVSVTKISSRLAALANPF